MLPLAPRSTPALARPGVLGRRLAVSQKILDRRARGAREVHAAHAQLPDRARRLLRRDLARPAPGPAAGREPRHAQERQRLAELDGVALELSGTHRYFEP